MYRAVLIDREPGTMDSVRPGLFGQLFRLDNFTFGHTGCRQQLAKGHYTKGTKLIDSVLDVVRKEAEGRDSLSHSLGSGTGSGMENSSVLEGSRREPRPHHGDLLHDPMIPSPKVSGTVVHPYYAVLEFPSARRNRDTCMFLDSEGLYDICSTH